MAEKHLRGVGTGRHTELYQEETLQKGGAAVMRMILGSEKVGLSPLPSQTDLYNDAIMRNRAGEPAGTWHIDPQGLNDSLMHFKPASIINFFLNYNFASSEQNVANAKIVDTIETYEVAPAVLVSGGPQWVAVVGYRTNAAGALEAIFLNDPRPPISDGSGDPPDFEVAAATWNTNYFKPVDGGTFWKNKFAMVCDPDQPKGELPAAKQKPRADGRQIINPDQAIELTRELLRERGSLERELFARAIKDGQPTKPQLVQILHQEDQFYYLVRFQIQGQDAAVVALDARFGVFLEAIAYRNPLRFFKVTRDQVPGLFIRGLAMPDRLENVRDRIVSWLFQNVDPKRPGIIPGLTLPQVSDVLNLELARFLEPLRFREIRAEEINVHSTMVWQPSAESMSLLYPFHFVTTPKQAFYVRAADALILHDLKWIGLQRLGG